MNMNRRNQIAQWAFDTRAILGRFHLWLEDVQLRPDTNSITDGISFVGGSLERAFVVATALAGADGESLVRAVAALYFACGPLAASAVGVPCWWAARASSCVRISRWRFWSMS